MAFNKKKALEEAAKLVSQRKISQAIKQYLVIAEQDPQDLPLLNIIGDLCVREGDISEALRQFHKLADAYTREGFTLKAIAIYKKIVKLDTRSVDPILRLAELYAAQRLSHEANEQYTQALALCQRNSLHDKAGQILRKLVGQDPANTAYRLRLAEFCRNAGQSKEALSGYLEATGIFYRQKNLSAANSSLLKAVEIEPETAEVILWQARLTAEAGQFEEAERIIHRSPELGSSAEGRDLLLRIYLGSGRLKDASALVVDAYRSGPEGLSAVAEFTAHCSQAGNPGAALDVLREIPDLAFERGQSSEFAALLKEPLEARPHDAHSLDLLSALCERIGNGEIPPALLEALGKAYASAVQWAKAEAVFRLLASRDERNVMWQSLLAESQEKQQAETIAGPPPALPAVTKPTSSSAPPAEESPEIAEPRPSIPSPSVASIASEAVEPQDGSVDLDFSNEWESFAPATPSSGSEQPQVAELHNPPLAEAREETAAAKDPIPPAPVAKPEAQSSPADLSEGKSEVEFYLDCGFLAEGSVALDHLARKYPGHPQVIALRDRLAALAAPQKVAPEPLAPPQAGPVEPPPPVHLAETPRGFFKPETEEPAVERLFEPAPEIVPESPKAPSLPGSAPPVEAEEEAGANPMSPPPMPGNASILRGLAQDLEETWDEAEKPPTREPGPDRQPSSVPWTSAGSALDDLALDLDITLDEAEESVSPTSAAQAAGEASPSLFDSSLEELLSELNAGEESAPPDDTPQTHYNLGVAFREMGLLDEAIGEFQKVVKGTAPSDPSLRGLEACSMLGICFMEKQMPEIAVRWLSRALQSPGLNEETTMALTYDLATAYEQCGNGKDALEKFSEVYSTNIDYRDVAEKIQSLHSKRA